ncbi:MAG: hypothetical protein J6Y94_01785, partial [Bacteriovoracaceae bacterium]|nr:hypothetical protein [Bacteriovoracaceae bacterium]
MMAVVIAGGCGTANSWETCTDGFHIYNPSGSVPSSAYDQFKDKYCALNYAYASCSCAEVEKSCGDKDISYKAEENEYCVNCDIFGDCKIEYKVVLRNNQQNVGEIDYVFYAKLENEKGDDSKKADGTPSYTTCPKCSETLLTFNIDKISGALSYKLAGSSQSGEVVVSPEGSLYLSDIRYTKIATLTFNLPSISFSSNKLEELR